MTDHKSHARRVKLSTLDLLDRGPASWDDIVAHVQAEVEGATEGQIRAAIMRLTRCEHVLSRPVGSRDSPSRYVVYELWADAIGRFRESERARVVRQFPACVERAGRRAA